MMGMSLAHSMSGDADDTTGHSRSVAIHAPRDEVVPSGLNVQADHRAVMAGERGTQLAGCRRPRPAPSCPRCRWRAGARRD